MNATKGEANAVGVHAMADGNSVEYFDKGGVCIKRQWNHDGTVAYDSAISKDEYDIATGKVKPAAPGAVPKAVGPSSTVAKSSADQQVIKDEKAATIRAAAPAAKPAAVAPKKL